MTAAHRAHAITLSSREDFKRSTTALLATVEVTERAYISRGHACGYHGW